MDNFCLNEPNFFKQQTLTPKSREAVLNPKFFLHNYLLKAFNGRKLNPFFSFYSPSTWHYQALLCDFFDTRTQLTKE